MSLELIRHVAVFALEILDLGGLETLQYIMHNAN